MLQDYLLSIYLKGFEIYSFLWTTLINFIGPLKFVYYFDGKHLNNITLNYHLGICLSKYIHGYYYCKFMGQEKNYHFTYHGNIQDINHIDFSSQETPAIKRKKIILLHKNIPIEFDLNILDNYVQNTKYLGQNKHFNLKTILEFLGVNCDEIEFISLLPFKKERRKIKNVTVTDIYE